MIYHINDIDLNINIEGKGPVIVMIHGNGESHHTFNVLKDSLVDSYTVVTYDSRNHGESQKNTKLSYDLMSKDLDAILKYFDFKDVCTLGYSDGGIVSLLSSIKHQPRLKEQILLGINLSAQSFTQEVYDDLVERYERTQDDFARLMIEEPNITLEECAQVNIPTILFFAEDEPFTQESIDVVSKAIQTSTLIRVKGHDHGSYISSSDYLNEFIRSNV